VRFLRSRSKEAELSSIIKKLSPVEVEIEITVPAEAVGAAIEGALARLTREAQIRGFRKGRAPRSVVKRMYGKAVLGELATELVSEHYVAALTEHDLDPVADPELVSPGELEEGKPFTCSLKVEVGPRLESLNVDGVELERHKVAPSPAEIDEELHRLQSVMAKTTVPAEPRPAKAGDAIRLEIRRWRDGAWQEQPLPPQELVLDADEMRPELYAALPGLGVGDEREVAFAPEAPETEPAKFLCKVLEIKERALPEIDDELAKDVGDFETLAALKDDIAKRRAEAMGREEEKRQRHELFDKLREKNPLELPPRVVAQQAEMMASQLLGMMSRGGSEEGLSKDATDKLGESARTAAREIVHQHFLIREIARLNELAVTDEDVEAELVQMAASTGLPLPQIKARMAQGGRLTELKVGLMERKVFDFVKPKVKITDIDPPATPTGGEDR
jgi:trigger factor